MSKIRNCTEGSPGLDLLGAWRAAKEQAEAEVEELKGKYPPDVVRRIFEALTCRHFWDNRK